MEELFYEFPCGCKVKQDGESIKDYDSLPKLKIDFYNLPLNCPATYALLATGRTRGVFQSDSNFGKQYCKKLGPEHIEHVAALSAILRPGCISSISEGKTETDHFIDRKNNKEPVTYLEEKLEKYLFETYGIMIYQEQAINIAKGIAGFTPEEANKLRKAIGKKKADELAKLRDRFIEGCMTVSGYTKEIATALFNNIEASNRYAFNKSHSVSYSFITYWTAWCKTHFPQHFYCSSLKFALGEDGSKDWDKLKDLMSETPLFDIEIKNPSINNVHEKFTIKDGYIQYGLGEVKSVGKSARNLIEEIIQLEEKLKKQASEFEWYEFLILISQKVCKTAINNLLLCGILDHTGVSRNRQLHEYNTLSLLKTSKVKMKWIEDNYKDYNNLQSLLEGLLETTIKVEKPKKKTKKKIELPEEYHEEVEPEKENRDYEKISSLVNSLKNPGKSLDDSQKNLYKIETELMGVAISADPISTKDRLANIKCAAFNNGKGSNNLKFVVVVKSVKEKTVKTGKNEGKKYASIILTDKTGDCEVTVFTKEWMDLKPLLVEGNVVLVYGKRSQDSSLRIESVEVL